MKLLPLVASVFTSLVVAPAAIAAENPPILNVWPGVAPGSPGNIGPEQLQQNKPGEKPFKRATNVTKPTLEVFRPDADKNTGVAVIVCPGGGYRNLMMDYEGEDVAGWLNTIGVTGIVLKYRVPAPEGQPKYLPALQDAQRAMSLVRGKAGEWGIDPKRIGILGFSAGGHLSAALATNFEHRAYEAIDEVDKVSCRPDFAVPVYPGGVIEKGKDELSPEIRVTKETPPLFIVQAHDDRVNSENSVFLYLAAKRAGVSAELHIYAAGGHGFGIRPSDKPCSTWPQRLAEWMVGQGILKPKAS